ncbi:hypothetical protein VPG91_29995 [Nitrospirillum amazonense]|uniref:hypothetical protein n=1 Tax=Nitrospirillum amazonense TaxID=28077 RepID=UPI002DD427D6|nr:hypothetical protein [Nitrospirillum amazonense]MEC4595259.1 hypothetical protein [Nitrospirillum amazonense]
MALVMMSSGLSFQAHAAIKKEVTYYCPKYDSAMQFQGNMAVKQYGTIYPDSDEFSSNANSISNLTDCSNATTLCVHEKAKKAKEMQGDDFVYAIPKHTHVGDEYTVENTSFSVKFAGNFTGKSPLYGVVAERPAEDGKIIRYKFYVLHDVGITDLFFEKLYATYPWAPGMQQIAYTDVSCHLVTGTGLLSGVKIQPYATGPRID